MEDLAKLKEQLEHIFINVIIADLKSKELSSDEAKKIAQDFIKIDNFSSVEDAKSKIDNFVSENPKFSYLKKYADVYLETEKTDQKIELIKKNLKENNIDEAIKVIES